MRHRAEDLRHALPESNAILADLRDQAMPVVEAAREQTERVRGRRSRRSRKPLLLVALLALGALAAYLFISRRDNQPAYLVPTPEEPLTPPSAADPASSGPEAPAERHRAALHRGVELPRARRRTDGELGLLFLFDC